MKLDRKLYQKILHKKTDNPSYNDTHKDRFIYIVNAINKSFQEPQEVKVLDFGSHVGTLSLLLKHFDYDITGIDIDEVISNHTDNYTNANIPYDSLKPDWHKLPYGDDHFDCIVFSEVLEHLYESPIKILEELYRVIKPGGILLLTTPNVMKIENKIKFFLNMNIYQDLYRFCYDARFGLHYREYTKKDLSVLLSQFIQFKKLDFYYFDYVGGRTRVNRALQQLLFIFTKLLYFFRGSIMVIATK